MFHSFATEGGHWQISRPQNVRPRLARTHDTPSLPASRPLDLSSELKVVWLLAWFAQNTGNNREWKSYIFAHKVSALKQWYLWSLWLVLFIPSENWKLRVNKSDDKNGRKKEWKKQTESNQILAKRQSEISRAKPNTDNCRLVKKHSLIGRESSNKH